MCNMLDIQYILYCTSVSKNITINSVFFLSEIQWNSHIGGKEYF